MRIGAVGELEPAQPIIGGRQAEPGFGIAACVARPLLDRVAEIALGKAEIVGAVMPFPQVEVVVGVARREGLGGGDLGVGRDRAGRLRSTRGRRRSVPGGSLALARMEEGEGLVCGLTAGQPQQARGRREYAN